MIEVLHFEWNRAMRSKRIWFVLGAGMLCSVLQAVHYEMGGIVKNFYENSDYPIVCWLSYLGRDIQLFYRSLYYLIFPIMAALPFAASYYEDKQSGYQKVLFMKVKRNAYAAAKYLVAFVTGGLVTVLPLMFSLFLHAGFVPGYPPSELSLQAVPLDGQPYCNIFYEHPFFYAVIFWGIDFLVGGCIAGIALCFSLIAKMKYSIYVFGFVFCILERTILYQFDCVNWAFSNIAEMTDLLLNGWEIFTKLIVTVIFSFALFVGVLTRKDVL